MPDIRDKSTIKAIAREFTSNSRNKTQAMITVGYDEGYADSGKGHKTVFGNIRVIAEIKRIDDEREAESDFTRADQLKSLNTAKDLATTQKQPAALVSAIREQNEMLGYHRDKAPNQEKQQAIANRMSEQEKAIAEEVARILTDKAANGPKLSKVI